eukprot:TRINITY_DN46123_c0_g1_i1.p1 TRINITY_DN46123_c0_g1~~TRINITY_DN46123_c0_g1_i1.p1  ORF type:complete len:147 (+),score=15.72 TRINITY_DN46123_c0_g1_i1:3-443(+)
MKVHLQRGFTLVEVMIVVAIVAILTSIALPAYNDYLRRGRISEAVAALSAQRIRMEQFFQDNRTYVGACVAGTAAPPIANTTTWSYSCPTANLTATAYKVIATGQQNMSGFVYTLEQGDARSTTITGVPGWSSNTTCWVLSKSGAC